jgi:Secretion system C-terminal sorting domain
MVGTENSIQYYTVEEALDGKDFKAIATINATGKQKYSYIDKDLANGINYFRIKAVDKDGNFKYSMIKNISHTRNGNLKYSIYPNPARNEVVIKNLTGNNTISIVDASGRVVMTRKNVNIGLATFDISTLKNGFYNVIVNNGVENKTLKIVVKK